MNKYFIKLSLFLILFFTVEELFAADESTRMLTNIMLIILAVLVLVMFGVLVFLEENMKTPSRAKSTPGYVLWLKGLFMSVKDPDEDPLIDHEYDGIKEFDNKVPPMLNYIMIATVIFAVVYMLHYHVLGTGDLPKQEYAKEMEAAAMQRQALILSGAFINEDNVVYDDSPEALESGKKIYDQNCVACHGAFGEGTVGPNLTDGYYKHGGSMSDIFRVISEGIPEAGMISWKAQLNPKQIQDVSSYVYSLVGTYEGGKEPEGEFYDRDAVKKENGDEQSADDENTTDEQ